MPFQLKVELVVLTPLCTLRLKILPQLCVEMSCVIVKEQQVHAVLKNQLAAVVVPSNWRTINHFQIFRIAIVITINLLNLHE